MRSRTAHEAGSHALDRSSVSLRTLDTGTQPSCPPTAPARGAAPPEHGWPLSSTSHQAGHRNGCLRCGRAAEPRDHVGGPAHPVATLSPRPRPWREQLLFGASCADLSCPPHPSTDAFAGLGFPKSSLHGAQQPVTAAAGVKPCLAHGRLAGHSASVSLPLPWLRCPLLTGLLPPPCCAISASATAAVCCAPGTRRSSEEPGARAGGAVAV